MKWLMFHLFFCIWATNKEQWKEGKSNKNSAGGENEVRRTQILLWWQACSQTNCKFRCCIFLLETALFSPNAHWCFSTSVKMHIAQMMGWTGTWKFSLPENTLKIRSSILLLCDYFVCVLEIRHLWKSHKGLHGLGAPSSCCLCFCVA